MTALVLALQVVLPLALIAWQAFLPAGSLAGFVLRAAGAGAFLFALALGAQWAVPVWWLPLAYGGLWLVAVLAWLLRPGLAGRFMLPDAPKGWAGLACR